jgi:hypothetical protein
LLTPDEEDDAWMLQNVCYILIYSNAQDRDSDDEVWLSLENQVAETAQKKKEDEEKKNNWINPKKVRTDEEIAQASR